MSDQFQKDVEDAAVSAFLQMFAGPPISTRFDAIAAILNESGKFVIVVTADDVHSALERAMYSYSNRFSD